MVLKSSARHHAPFEYDDEAVKAFVGLRGRTYVKDFYRVVLETPIQIKD